MERKKFFVSLILFIFFFLVLLAGYALLVNKFKSTPHWMNALDSTIKTKNSIAAEKGKNKIIIVGASTSLDGISAELIEKRTGIPAVNYSLFAGLELYSFHLVKKIAQPGDTILLEPSFYIYRYNDKKMFAAQTEKERYILTYDPDYYYGLNFLQKMNILIVGADDLHKNIKFENIKKTVRQPKLNDWGDEILEPTTNKEWGSDGIQHYNIPNNFIDKFNGYAGTQGLKDFIEWTKENQIKTYAVFPAVYYKYDALDKNGNKGKLNKEALEAIEKFYSDNGVKTIGSPKDYFYENADFFHEPYHLNDEGRIFKTEYILAHWPDNKLN
ncbi:MAG: hypothetical protein V1867_06290 [Candidatus Falkowbacteria bacterium]